MSKDMKNESPNINSELHFFQVYAHTHDHSFATILICKMAYPRTYILINISHHYDIIKRAFSYIIINSTFVQRQRRVVFHSIDVIMNITENTIRKFFWNCHWFLGCLSNCTNVICLQNKRIIKFFKLNNSSRVYHHTWLDVNRSWA